MLSTGQSMPLLGNLRKALRTLPIVLDWYTRNKNDKDNPYRIAARRACQPSIALKRFSRRDAFRHFAAALRMKVPRGDLRL